MAEILQLALPLLLLRLGVDGFVDAVADALDRRLDPLQIEAPLIEADGRRLGGEVHLGKIHPLQLVERALNSRGAGSAGHALDAYSDLCHASTS